MDRPFRAFQMIPKGHLKAKVMALLLSGQWWAYLSIGTTGLGAAVKMLRSIFTFLTLKWPLKGQPRSKVIADSEPLGLISHLCSIVTIGLYLAPFRRNSPIPADRRRRQTDRQQCSLAVPIRNIHICNIYVVIYVYIYANIYTTYMQRIYAAHICSIYDIHFGIYVPYMTYKLNI